MAINSLEAARTYRRAANMGVTMEDITTHLESCETCRKGFVPLDYLVPQVRTNLRALALLHFVHELDDAARDALRLLARRG